MRTIILKNDRHTVEVSRLVFGTGSFGYLPPEEAYAHLDTYYALEGRTIDTARVYSLFNEGDTRSSEKAIGEWLARTGLRSEMVIGTKGGHPRLNAMHIPRLSKADLEEDLQLSLTDLGCDNVDIYWLHRDDIDRPVGDIMETLHGFVQQGLVKTIGASNWTMERVEEANRYAKEHGLTSFSAIQVQWSYAKMCRETLYDPSLILMDEAMLQRCEALQLPVFAFSSQASAVFQFMATTSEENIPKSIHSAFLAPYVREENERKFATMQQLSAEYGISLTAASVAYLTCNPHPAAAICGCQTVEQWRDSLSVADMEIPFEKFH